MKVGRLAGPGAIVVDSQAEPTVGAGEVLVELAACGVCGTDLEKLRGNYKSAGILGHEPVGVISKVGEGVQLLAVGDRVFVHHHVPCYACPICQRGDYTFCPTYSKTNIDPGGFAERFRVPKVNVEHRAVLRLSDHIDWATGALLEPAGCALTALHRIGFQKGWSLFILGLGPVGLLYGEVAAALGASWVGGAEISPLRRAAAMRGSFQTVVDPRDAKAVQEAVTQATDRLGVDLAVIATGAPAAIQLGARLPRRGGIVNLFGLPEAGSRLEADLQELYLRGVRVVPSYATTEPDIAEVHSLVVSGRLRLRRLVSHTIPLDRFDEAIALAQRPDEALKVVVTGPAYA